MSKSSEQHQSNSRLGILGESLVQTFLLEYCDWCYPTQDKHPADLLVELGSAKYTVQVKTRRETKEGKYVFAAEPSRAKSEVYRQYHCDILAFNLNSIFLLFSSSSFFILLISNPMNMIKNIAATMIE